MSEQSQEWTPDALQRIVARGYELGIDGWKTLSEKINAALAAERKLRHDAEVDAMRIGGLLLQAQAAIAEHNKRCEPGNLISDIVRPITLDLSALEEARHKTAEGMKAHTKVTEGK